MKKPLSLAFSFIISSVGLFALAARPALAQQVASAGVSIGKIKEEYERLLAVDRDPSIEPDVRELNRKFLEERRVQLRSAIETRLGALRKYQTSMSGALSTEESLVVGDSIQSLERDLAALKDESRPARAERKSPSAASAPRARLVTASASRRATAAKPETARPEPENVTAAPGVRAEAGAPAPPDAAPEPMPRREDPIEISSPSADTSVGVDKIEIEIKVNDDAIDDVMVAVYAAGAEKPFGARVVEIKRSDKGLKKVPLSLRKGENRVEVTSSQSPAAKAVKKITYKPADLVGGAASPGNSGGGAIGGASLPAVTTPEDFPEYDWGRVRAYFAGGVILSKERANFSKTDMFLDFTLDKNYFASPSRKIFKDFNSFFNARLTSIPVAQPAGAEEAATTCTTNTPDCENFLTSEKGALLQAGFYLPMYGKYTTWLRRVPYEKKTGEGSERGSATIERKYRYERDALFVAPLLKGGIQTITGERTTAEGTRFGGDDVFNFFSYGLMLGHFRIPTKREQCKGWEEKDNPGVVRYASDCYVGRDGRGYRYVRNTNLAPELISWLTVSRGRWESFELTVPTGFNDKDGNPITVRERPWRYEALGRLKVPNTPFIIGFDGNFGKGPDDLRFIFGTRFDIGKVFTALRVGQAAKQPSDSAPSPDAAPDEDTNNTPAPQPR
jgi:hypothetical protein